MKQPKKILEYERYATRADSQWVDRTKMRKLLDMFEQTLSFDGSPATVSIEECKQYFKLILREARAKIIHNLK